MVHSSWNSATLLLLLLLAAATACTLAVVVTVRADHDDSHSHSATRGYNSPALERIEKTLNNNKHQQLNSASTWLNAGATLMQESGHAGTVRRILVAGKDYDCEAALVRALEIDPNLSVGWHYLASVLTTQSLTRFRANSNKNSNNDNDNNNDKSTTIINHKKLLAKANVGSVYYTALDALKRSVEMDTSSAKAWIGASHLLRELHPLFLDEMMLSNSNDNKNKKKKQKKEEEMTTQQETDEAEAQASDVDVLLLPQIEVASVQYDAVLCAEQSLQLDRNVSTTWTHAAKALHLAKRLGAHSSLVHTSGNKNILTGPSLMINPADPNTRADAIDCMISSLSLYPDEVSAWEELCAILKEQEDDDGEGQSDDNKERNNGINDINNNDEEKTKKNRAVDGDSRRKWPKKLAVIAEQRYDYAGCLARVLHAAPQSAETWLALGRRLAQTVIQRSEAEWMSSQLIAPLSSQPSSLLSEQLKQQVEDDTSSSSSSVSSSISLSALGEPSILVAVGSEGSRLREFTAVTALEEAFRLIPADRKLGRDGAAAALDSGNSGSISDEEIIAGWHDGCVVMTLSGIDEATMRGSHSTTVDAFQCWELLLTDFSSTGSRLPGGVPPITDSSQKANIWRSLGATLASAERKNALLVSSSNSAVAGRKGDTKQQQRKATTKQTVDEIFVSGVKYDAAAAYVRAIELNPKKISAWSDLGRLLSFRETNNKRNANNKKSSSSSSSSNNNDNDNHHGKKVTRLRIGPRQFGALELFARAVELAPSNVRSWELLCHELAEREKTAETERPSVEVQMPVAASKAAAMRERGEPPPPPLRIEQQLCFLELFRRDPENAFAWTSFKLITDGAAVQVPNPEYDFAAAAARQKVGGAGGGGSSNARNSNNNINNKEMEMDDPQKNIPKAIKISNNLDFRVLAVKKFPQSSTMWLQLGQELNKRELNVVEFNESLHVDVDECFRRAVELDPTSSDAWLFFSSVIPHGSTSEVSLLTASSGSSSSPRLVSFSRVQAAVRAIKLNKNNAAAWQQVASYLAEPVLFDPYNDAKMDQMFTTLSTPDDAEEENDAGGEDKSSGAAIIVTPLSAALRAIALDETLFGAWQTLAELIRHKHVQETGGVLSGLAGSSATGPVTSVELQTASGVGNGRRVTVPDCFARAIEITDVGGVRRQSRSAVLTLYEQLLASMIPGRHVSVNGMLMLSSDVEKKIRELQAEITKLTQRS